MSERHFKPGSPAAQAAILCRILTGESDPVMDFRCVDERPDAKAKVAAWRKTPKDERGPMRFNYRGKLSALFPKLKVKNEAGWAVYYSVNRSDGEGRKRANMLGARAVAIDLDGAPLPKTWKIRPHVILESSPGKFQCLWAINETDNFAAHHDMMMRLAIHYGGDRSVCDITRVLRLAGFLHQKAKPFRSRIVEHVDPEELEFGRLDLSAFDWLPPLPEREAKGEGDGDTITTEQLAALFDAMPADRFATYADWLKIGMAAHKATDGEGLEVWQVWCATNSAFDDADSQDECEAKWDTFDSARGEGVGIGTLRFEAEKAGVPKDVLNRIFSGPAASAHDAFGDDAEAFTPEPADDSEFDGDNAEDVFESDEAQDEDEFESVFILDGNDRPKADSQHNVRLALDMLGARVSYNQFSDRILIEGLKSFGPYLDDAALDRLWLKVDEDLHFRPSRAFFDTVVADYARRRSFHPVRDYFDKAQAAWDGKPRIDRLLIDYAGAEDSPYMRAVSALPLIATVRRVRQPGAKYDEAVVMESIQGKLKSTFLATLAINPEWFTDSLPLHANQKETIEFTSGKLIVEFADLHGLKKADIDQVKAQLSRAADRARLAYGKLPVERPRQWIPWGTANNDNYLRDQTGNRRFWPAKINHCDIPKLKADLQQLWGEAATREAAGESIRLPPALYGAATAEQEKRLDTKTDPFTDALAHAFGDITGKITSEAVWHILGITVAGNRTQHQNERMGAAMRYLGWKRKSVRIGKQRRPGYVKGEQPLREIFVHGDRGDVRVSHDKDDGVQFDG